MKPPLQLVEQHFQAWWCQTSMVKLLFNWFTSGDYSHGLESCGKGFAHGLAHCIFRDDILAASISMDSTNFKKYLCKPWLQNVSDELHTNTKGFLPSCNTSLANMLAYFSKWQDGWLRLGVHDYGPSMHKISIRFPQVLLVLQHSSPKRSLTYQQLANFVQISLAGWMPSSLWRSFRVIYGRVLCFASCFQWVSNTFHMTNTLSQSLMFNSSQWSHSWPKHMNSQMGDTSMYLSYLMLLRRKKKQHGLGVSGGARYSYPWKISQYMQSPL